MNKLAQQERPRGITQILEDNPELAVLPITTAAGVGFSQPDKKNPMPAMLSGGLKGLAAGAGGLAGYHLGSRLSGGDTASSVAGAGTGGILSLLLASHLLRNTSTKREKRSLHPVLQQLIDAKALSDKREYRGKHQILHKLIKEHPDDFVIDSTDGDIVGITHFPSRFKIHAPERLLPVKLRRIDNATQTV